MTRSGWWQSVDQRLGSRGWQTLGWGLAGVGFVLALQTLVSHGIQGAGGLGGIDAIAYWRAADRVLHGQALYEPLGYIGGFGFYQYPPPFAQLLAPLSLLPMERFVWAWRAVELLCLRVAVGSWQRAGLALLFWPPVLAELDAGNIHLLMAAATALAMRGFAGFVGPTFLLKFASWPLLPIAIALDRTRAAAGAAIALVVLVASFLLAPGAWRDYLAFLGSAHAPEGWYNVLAGMPVLPRLALAGGLGLAAVRYIRLAPLAVTLAYPVVWFHGLSTLVALAAPVPERERGPRNREDHAAWTRDMAGGGAS